MIRLWRCRIVRPKALFFACHGFLLAALFAASASWRFQEGSLSAAFHSSFGLMLMLLALQVCSYCSGLDALVINPNFTIFANRGLASLMMGLAMIFPLFLLFPNLFPGHGWAIAAIVSSGVVLLLLRPILRCLIRHRRFVDSMLILGTGELAKKFYQELAYGKNGETRGFAQDIVPADCIGDTSSEAGVFINYEQLFEISSREGISGIIIAEAEAQSSEALATALVDCKLQGLEVEEAIDSYEKLSGKVWLEALRPEWLVYTDGFKPSRYYLQFKRIFDPVCALLLVLLTAPLFVVIAVLVKLDSKGPVLFRQVRVGFHGKTFVLLKFRTMRQDAESITGPVWASKQDSRATRVGKYLRLFRLDELPQAINVLRGEMNLIGPRPERPCFVEMLTEHIPFYGLRHYIKPGITGWAQVLFPYGASVEDSYEKLQYDLYYAKHMSMLFDLQIVLSTVKVVVFGRGR